MPFGPAWRARRRLPADIRALAEMRQGDIYLSENASEMRCMAELGIDPESEFHALFSTLVMDNMVSPHGFSGLSPIADSAGALNPAIAFAWQCWALPRRYIAMTSLEGEGGYFFDSESGAVVDFELAHRDAFMAGDIRIIAGGAFEFMRWYLADKAEPRGYAAAQ